MQTKSLFRFVSTVILLAVLSGGNYLPAAAEKNTSDETDQVLIIFPDADASVNQEFPDQNYGSEKSLNVTDSPLAVGYLRFTIDNLPEGILRSARLRIYVQNANSSKLSINEVPSNDWTENILTFQNSPIIENEITRSKRLSRGHWTEFNLSKYIRTGGVYTFALTASKENSNIILASREDEDKAPRLELRFEKLDTQPTKVIPVTDTPTEIPSLTTSEMVPTEFPTQPSLQLTLPSSNQSPAIQASAAVFNELTFVPEADAYVNKSSPKTNYGGLTALRVDNSPILNSYLRFNVSGLGGQPISQARLMVHANSGSSKGIAAKTVIDTTWGELSIKYNNAPSLGNTLSMVPNVSGGTWVELDVTSVVIAENRYSFGLITPGSTSINLSSRESGANSPYLIITVNGDPTPETPTNTANPTATITPINLPTLTSTSLPLPTSTATSTPIFVPSPTSTPLPLPTSTATSTPIFVPSFTSTPLPLPTSTATSFPTVVFTPTATPNSGSDPVLVGAGDIASCSSTGDEATANLLDMIPGIVFTTGDNAYESGSISEYVNCYNPTWGRFKARTMPSAGNHDYVTAGATGYYAYFGAAAGDPGKGYYSYNLGKWHIVVLNSEISTSTSSEQVTWLRQDLAANPVACTLAYWHRPRFSSGAEHGSSTSVQPLWQALYDYKADVIINGHDHTYERFAPQSPTGASDSNGIREFVAGMGGKSHYGFGTILPNSEVQNADTYGVLKLTLHDTSYDWQFVPVAGKTFTDSGNANCVQ